MEIRKEENPEGGKYMIEENSQKVGELIYTLGPNRLIINHTEVEPSYRVRE